MVVYSWFKLMVNAGLFLRVLNYYISIWRLFWSVDSEIIPEVPLINTVGRVIHY